MIGEEKGSVAISGRSSHKMTGLIACFPTRISSAFQGTAASKVQLTANCIAAIRWPTLYQTDLRIIYHTEDTNSTVTDAPFIQNSNRMAADVDRNTELSERIF